MGWGNPSYLYRLTEKLIQSSSAEKDLRVLMDEKFYKSQQCVFAAKKANSIQGCTKREVASKDKELIVLLCSCEAPSGVVSQPGVPSTRIM